MMTQKVDKRQLKTAEKRKKHFKRYERRFSAHHYRGKGRENVGEISGSSCVLLASPFSVSVGDVPANLKTGGLTRLLAYEIGCSAIFTQKTLKKDLDNIGLKKNFTEKIRRIHPQIILEIRTVISESACFCIEAFSDSNSYTAFFSKSCKICY